MAFTKPRDYDSAPSFDSDTVRLPAGGYLCEIKGMEEGQTRKGSTLVHVFFDIAEGEYKGYYERMYKSNKATVKNPIDVRWKGVYDVFPTTPEGTTSGAWKGLLTCIERSNGYTIDWHKGYDQFKGKKVGLLLREEEYISSYDNSKRTVVRPCAARTWDTIRDGDFQIPSKKGLNLESTSAAAPAEFTQVEVDDDQLPF